jgi:hypothetical protein
MTPVQAFVKLIRRSTLKRKPPVRAGNAQAPWPLEPWQSGSETRVNCLETAFVAAAEFATTIAPRSRKYAASLSMRFELPYRHYGLTSSIAFRTFCACTDFRLADRGRTGGGP